MDLFGIPLKYAVGMGGGWLTTIALGVYVLKMVLNRKMIPEATHLEIVGRITSDCDGWKAAFFGLAEVNAEKAEQTVVLNVETARIIRDYLAAQQRVDAIEATTDHRVGEQT